MFKVRYKCVEYLDLASTKKREGLLVRVRVSCRGRGDLRISPIFLQMSTWIFDLSDVKELVFMKDEQKKFIYERQYAINICMITTRNSLQVTFEA